MYFPREAISINRMAMKKRLKYRLDGNTLIEVLVSLSLISVLFVMGMYLWMQIAGPSNPIEQQKVRQMMLEFLAEPWPEGLEEQEREQGHKKLIRSFEPIREEQGLFQVTVRMYSKDQFIHQVHQLAFYHEK